MANPKRIYDGDLEGDSGNPEPQPANTVKGQMELPVGSTELREPPSRFCEVWVDYQNECGKPATHAYPAMGGGYMALCYYHAQKHPEAWPIKEIC